MRSDHEVELNISSKYINVPKHVDTGVPYPLVFVVSNIKKRNDVYGISDYDSIENLVKELETRIIKVSSILDIHSQACNDRIFVYAHYRYGNGRRDDAHEWQVLRGQ